MWFSGKKRVKKKEDRPIIGGIYRSFLDDGNPWQEVQKVKVIDVTVEGGWVKYRFIHDGKMSQFDHSLRSKTFLSIYKNVG